MIKVNRRTEAQRAYAKLVSNPRLFLKYKRIANHLRKCYIALENPRWYWLFGKVKLFTINVTDKPMPEAVILKRIELQKKMLMELK